LKVAWNWVIRKLLRKWFYEVPLVVRFVILTYYINVRLWARGSNQRLRLNISRKDKIPK
jgi:hypothetical protein